MQDRYGSIGNTPLTGYASGTLNARRGLAWAGENGRELIDFGGGGARVYNNRDSESMVDNSLLNKILDKLTIISGKSGDVLIDGDTLVGIIDQRLNRNLIMVGRGN